MIASRRRDYDAQEQRALAAWGARQAYAVLAVEGKGEGVPPWHREALRRRGEPHEDVFVGYGRYRKDHVGVLAARLLLPLGENREDIEAYSVLCIFGRMALKVFGVHRRPESTRVKPPEGEIVRVWPSHREVVDWPPLWSLDEVDARPGVSVRAVYRPLRLQRGSLPRAEQEVQGQAQATEGPGPRR